jgi:hypothetical protein
VRPSVSPAVIIELYIPLKINWVVFLDDHRGKRGAGGS